MTRSFAAANDDDIDVDIDGASDDAKCDDDIRLSGTRTG